MAPQRRGDLARAKLLATTADLLHRQGYASTGLNEILDKSGAPKGSLYFHFPGGKEQLVAMAIERSSEGLTQALAQLVDSSSSPSVAVIAVVRFFAAQLTGSKFQKGCPVATVVLEQAATSDVLQVACAGAYDAWHALVEQRLLRDGYSADRAASLANLILSTIEGALLVSRARRSVVPLERAGDELVRILQGDKR